jgi:Right handed beta helix region
LLKRLTISGCALAATLALAAPAFANTPTKTSATGTTANEWVATTGSDTNADATVNTCRIKKNPCLTIQHAIDVAPATGTINVAAGSYPEQLVINNQNLTIVGSASAKAPTVIDPDAGTLTSSNNDPLATGDPTSTIVLFEGTTSGGLTNVTVDGGNGTLNATNCTDDYLGVFLDGATATLKSSTVTGIDLPPNLFGCQQGFSIYAADANNASQTVTMSKVNVSNYDKDGILCDGAGLTCTISGSTVTGDGPNGDIGQNGIELDFMNSANVTTTKVSQNTYTNPNFPSTGATGASGILAFDDDAVSLTSNTLKSNDDAIFGENDNGIGSGVWTITGNTVSASTNVTASGANPVPDNDGVGDGLDLFGVDNATVTGNTIGTGAGAGMSLFGVTNSTFGGSVKGQANTISKNTYDGIVIGEFNGPSTANTFTGNVIASNNRDGIEVLAADNNGEQATGNLFTANKLQKNVRFDAEDLSTGNGTGGTANTWGGQLCAPKLDSNPAELCSAPPAP